MVKSSKDRKIDEVKTYRASEVLKSIFETFKLMDADKPKDQRLKRQFIKQVIVAAARGAMDGINPLFRGNMVNAAGLSGLSNPMVPVFGGLWFITDFISDRLWESEDKNRYRLDAQIRRNFDEYATRLFMDADPAFRLYTPLPSFNQAANTAANAMSRFAQETIRLASTGSKGVAAGAVLFGINKPIFLSLVGFGIINIAWSMAHQGKMLPLYKEHRKESREAHNRIGDIASNVSIIQRTSNEEKYKEVVSEELVQTHKNNIRLNFKDWAFYIKRNSLTSIANAAAAVGAFLIARATNLPIGTVLTSIDNTMQLSNAATNLAGIFSSIKKSLSEYYEALEILNSRTVREDKPNAVPLDIDDLRKNPPLIEFKDVTFKYPKRKKNKDGEDKDDGEEPKNVLENLNLVLRGGEKVAIMGESGIGKTTMLSLLLREYERQSGEIWIDGRKNDDVTLSTLRRAVRYIPQADGFLNRSVRENLLLVKPDATDEELKLALASAKVLEAVEEQGGLDTKMGYGGNSFSGGQKHRIGLARAFLGDAPVMVFDEPTSDLDTNTKRMVINGILDFSKGKTAIVITHDPAVAEQFDRIVFMQEGKIVDDGRPEDLLGNPKGAFYKAKSEHIGRFARIQVEKDNER
ncbi:MAG: ABC transporter ATP-binding protein/permease [Rickettsiales bacterium]|jgi:ABC-type multidrug transport system fused ATPase/permease subunit|nr:ABC transporter ATP-binding protein/permease [Rickettsiales bacterium]